MIFNFFYNNNIIIIFILTHTDSAILTWPKFAWSSHDPFSNETLKQDVRSFSLFMSFDNFYPKLIVLKNSGKCIYTSKNIPPIVIKLRLDLGSVKSSHHIPKIIDLLIKQWHVLFQGLPIETSEAFKTTESLGCIIYVT